MLNILYRIFARVVMHLWPFPFAHVRLMGMLKPPAIPGDHIITKLKGFPVKLKYDPNTYIGRYIYYRGVFEEQILDKMSELLKPGMTFLDVGANIGLHSVVSASILGKGGKVISIEPQSKVYQQLSENISLNNLENITVYKCALGSKSEKRELYQISSTNDGQATLALSTEESPKSVETVEVRPLGEIASEAGVDKIDGVKIDVEGAEFEVLKGASEFFQHHWPSFMLIECIDHHLQRFGSSSQELIEFLTSAGYSVYSLKKGSWSPIEQTKGVQADLLAIR